MKFHDACTDRGSTCWFAATVVARGEAGRTICGHFLTGSAGYEVAILSGMGPTLDDAYSDLEQKLVLMKSREPGPA